MGRALAVGGSWLLLAALAGALPASASAQQCSDDSDCADGFECDRPPSAGASSPDCDPGSGSCDSAPTPEPEPTVGECEPAELRCLTHADCPSGARCEIRGGDCASTSPAVPPDDGSGKAGAPAPPPPEQTECDIPDEGQCVFTVIECTADSQCEGDDRCTALGSRGCDDDPTAGDPGPAPTPTPCVGSSCPAPQPQPEPEPEPEQESCQETTISFCFPPIVDCGGGKACSGGTRCVELNEDLQEDAPPAFENITALCLPEVWALAFEERIEIDGGDSSAEGSGTSSGRSPAKSGDAAADDDAAESGGDDDCAVRAPGSRNARALWPLLGVGLLALGYRRRRA